jgi:cobyric acid synthase CobQ
MLFGYKNNEKIRDNHISLRYPRLSFSIFGLNKTVGEMCMVHTLMVQGTGSHVGKSILVTALCRIFSQDGFAVAPFKSQNMALNSFVTVDGGEMGRAQVVQAQAARIEPEVDMNPVLLKPSADNASQVVVHGKPIGTMKASYYHNNYVQTVWPAILDSFERLKSKYEIIVLEGAGSPAEVNLQKNDVVNMRAAHMAQAPVLLVADIDKGGALAAVVGTLELLQPEDRKMVAGIVINKFRGDLGLLQPALDFLEAKTGLPVLGVIPYFKLNIPEEDTVNDELRQVQAEDQVLHIGVLDLPHISNFTDFDPLEAEPDVSLRYINPGDKLGMLDCLIIPGSKNTIGDLNWIKKLGWDQEIIGLAGRKVPIIGICGGFQMLGYSIIDSDHIESAGGEAAGLGLLEVVTRFDAEKTTWQVQGEALGHGKFMEALGLQPVKGYEIHMGQSLHHPGVKPVFRLVRQNDPDNIVLDGAVNETGLVWGTYLHGLFDADEFRRAYLNQLRKLKGLPPLTIQFRFQDDREDAYDNLAELVRKNICMQKVYELMGL